MVPAATALAHRPRRFQSCAPASSIFLTARSWGTRRTVRH
jgi:hypothetical protein